MRLITLVLLLAAYAPAQSGPPRTLHCSAPESRQFDFWLGNWDVKSAGKTVGYSKIEKAVHGCAIVENWTGLDGDTGKSLNFFERSTSQWRQVYVGPQWSLDYRGKLVGNGLVFRSSRKLPAGQIVQLRLTFTPMPNGEVRQHKEQSPDGEAWKDVYDFRYVPRADDPPAVTAKDTCTAGPARQFDFWAGNWDVYVGKQLAGTNRIDRVVSGCLIFENWVGAKGGEGKSFNFYDAGAKQWRQVWMGAGGSLDLHGEWSDGAIRYSGDTLNPDGSHTLERLTFTPQPPGYVRQFWEQSNDGGKTWAVAFDGMYVPHGTKFPQ
jgi:hypothetical protein